MMSGLGVSADDIARTLNISMPTLRLYFEAELYQGGIDANAKVAQSLFRMATDASKPNVVAAIFWLKARAGWRDGNGEGSNKRDKAEEEAKQPAQPGDAWHGLLQ
jgi:hypothetical protein